MDISLTIPTWVFYIAGGAGLVIAGAILMLVLIHFSFKSGVGFRPPW